MGWGLSLTKETIQSADALKVDVVGFIPVRETVTGSFLQGGGEVGSSKSASAEQSQGKDS